MIRRPPRSTLDRSSAASDVYKRQLRRGRLALHAFLSCARGCIDRAPPVSSKHLNLFQVDSEETSCGGGPTHPRAYFLTVRRCGTVSWRRCRRLSTSESPRTCVCSRPSPG